MARTNAYTVFLADPDVEARRAELRAFVGPHCEPFMTLYERLRASAVAGGRPRFGATTGFVAMAFFLGPCWFFYRRMWAWAWSLTAALVVLAILPLPGQAGSTVGLVMALMGRHAYLTHAIGRIAKARGSAPVADLQALTALGGVSRVAGWVSGGVMLVLILLAIASIVVLARSGVDPATLR